MTAGFNLLLSNFTVKDAKNYLEDLLDRLELMVANTTTKVDDYVVEVLAGAIRASLDMKDEDREVVKPDPASADLNSVRYIQE